MAWTTKDLREDLKKLEEELKKSTNYKDRELIVYSMEALREKIAVRELQEYARRVVNAFSEDIVIDFDELEENEELTYFDKYMSDLNEVSANRLLYPDVENYLRIVNPLLKNNEHTEVDVGRYNLTEKDAIMLCNDFYRTFNNDIYNIFYKLLKNKNKMIRFEPTLDTYEGNFTNIRRIDSSYLEIGSNGDNKEEMLNTLTHESGHFIGANLSPRRYGKDRFLEIESLFFELLGADYYAKKLDSDYFRDRPKTKAVFQYNCGKNNIITKNAVDKTFDILSTVDNPYAYYTSLVKDRNEYLQSLNINNSMTYLYSYLIAIELYELYQQDPDRAIYALKRITSYDRGKPELQRIHENVEINKNVKKYTKKLNIS